MKQAIYRQKLIYLEVNAYIFVVFVKWGIFDVKPADIFCALEYFLILFCVVHGTRSGFCKFGEQCRVLQIW